MSDDKREDFLGKTLPPPRTPCERWTRRIQLIGIGPVPVGSLFLLIVFFVLPPVLVWYLLDELPHWALKVVIIGGAFMFYAYHLGVRTEKSDE